MGSRGEGENPSSLLFEESAKVEQLDQNYRSALNIVDFNNRFFSQFVDLFSPDLQQIYEGLNQSPTTNESGKVI